MDLQGLLKSHKMNRAKLKLLKLELAQMVESTQELIEALSLRAPSIGGIRCSSIGSKVENVALMDKTPEVNEDIIKISGSIYRLEYLVNLVDSAMEALTEREHYIITLLYFEEQSWQDLTDIYNKKYEFREERTLKRYRKEALNRLDEALKKHP